MSNDFLSQEEIDALLNGTSSDEPEEFDDDDKDLLGEIGNICMGSAATTLSILINQQVSITTPKVSLIKLSEFKETLDIPNIAIEVEFSGGLSGVNLLVLKVPDAGVIADLMMGGTGVHQGDTLSKIELSAVSESMNQMIGTAATSMATMFKREINISPPSALLWDNKSQKLSNVVGDDQKIVQVSFRLTIGDLVDSQIMQILSVEAAHEIIEAMTSGLKEPVPVPEPTPKPKQEYEGLASYEEEKQVSETPVQQSVPVHKAQFSPMEKVPIEVNTRNIELILDVPIEISAILGKTKKTIKDVLDLGNGSLIELDKLVEEPVEILVNGKMIAQGEVVVVNENFGVRITNIISSIDRVKELNK